MTKDRKFPKTENDCLHDNVEAVGTWVDECQDCGKTWGYGWVNNG